MSKKDRRAARKANRQQIRSRSEPEEELSIWGRMKKNPIIVLLGVFTIGAMVLGLGADLFSTNQPQAAIPTVPAVRSTATAVASTPPSTKETYVPKKTYTAPPAMTIDPNKSYTATIVTNKGSITLDLYPKVAPNHVNAFVNLARDGFYDGLTFHRVEDWVVQGGDPTGTGSGGPGYSLKAEFNPTKHITGTLSMARAQDPNSAGSQFFVLKTAAPWLDNQYSNFGQAITGMDVVNKLVKGDVIQKITIEEK